MPRIYIRNGSVVLKGALLKNAAISINGSKITAIGESSRIRRGALSLDAKGCFVSQGFIDCHIHGKPKDIFSSEVKFGTTSIVLAISVNRLDRISREIDEIKDFVREDPLGPSLVGIRLEGPYINRKKAGAQNKSYIRRPDKKELSRIINISGPLLKIITIAPELNGARPLIQLLHRKNVIASIGHSDATYEEASRGIGAGIRHVTHIFNAMSGLDRREQGVAGAVLFDKRVTAEIILDLAHVHETLFRLLLKTKPIDKIILVTDSVNSNPPEGARKVDGAYRMRNGRLVGSRLTMIEAVRNAVKVGGLSLVDAVRLATDNPARLLGIQNRKGSIGVGKDADIVIFDKNFDVKMTVINGEIVYKKRDF